jgi:hypothetical protein
VGGVVKGGILIIKKEMKKMETIYLIEKGWIDTMENYDADGYNPYGFMLEEEEAKTFCESQGYWTHKDCWSIIAGITYKDGKMPKYRYKKLDIIK